MLERLDDLAVRGDSTRLRAYMAEVTPGSKLAIPSAPPRRTKPASERPQPHPLALTMMTRGGRA